MLNSIDKMIFCNNCYIFLVSNFLSWVYLHILHIQISSSAFHQWFILPFTVIVSVKKASIFILLICISCFFHFLVEGWIFCSRLISKSFLGVITWDSSLLLVLLLILVLNALSTVYVCEFVSAVLLIQWMYVSFSFLSFVGFTDSFGICLWMSAELPPIRTHRLVYYTICFRSSPSLVSTRSWFIWYNCLTICLDGPWRFYLLNLLCFLFSLQVC